ncbi:MAG: hypothetical protein LBI82_03480 [Dysgonamonadaceae bacterium]|nr:hypothetical protein [Dysgonamonadaceae bacterium]
MSKVRFKVDNEGTRAKAYDIMGAVESAKEFGFVALYSFLFCGLVLSLDCFFIKESEFLLIFLHIFTISSFAFMFLFWKHLWSKVKSDNNKEIPEFMSHMDTRFSFVVLFFFVFLPLIFLIVMELLPVLKYRYWICLGVIFLIFLLAYYFGSKQKFRTIINTCNYNSLFMFSHFLYLLIGSLFISFIYYESLTCIQKYNTSIFFDQKNTIKYLICTFAITNAVFIPFFLSFFRYKIVWVRFCFKIKKKEKEKDKSVRKLEKEYGEIIEKIKNLVIENTSK